MRQHTTIALASLLVVLLGGGAWIALDAAEPDDRAYRAAPSLRGSAQGAVAVALSTIIVDLERTARQVPALQAVLRRGRKSRSDELGQVAVLEIVQRLPERLESIAKHTDHRPRDVRRLADDKEVSRDAVQLIRLLTSIMQHHLERSSARDAWPYATSALQSCRLLQREATNLQELVVMHACLSLVAAEISRGIHAGKWEASQLGAIVALDTPKFDSRQFLLAMRHEYDALFSGLTELENDSPLRRVLYHPNETKREWIRALDPMFDRLEAGDAAAAFRRLQTRQLEIAMPWFGRNKMGYGMLVTALPSYSSPLEQFVTSSMKLPLLRVDAALELYRCAHGKLPSTLEELTPEPLSELPLDVWARSTAGLRYKPSERRLYSVGPNGLDDGGSRMSFTYDDQTDDYGVRLRF